MIRTATVLLTTILATCTLFAADQDPELKLVQGRWEVIELVENGKVIPKEAVREWLPSGGQFEIVENAILFKSHDDGKKQVKIFSLDATQYPKGIDLSSRGEKDAHGIYRVDNDRLIICLAEAEGSERPKEFSAKEGSHQVLMTLQRLPKETTPQPAPKKQETASKQPTSGTTATVLTDAQVAEMVKGTWKYADRIGVLFITLNSDGSFSTVREVKEIRLFQKVFVQTPVSTGRWSVNNGRLVFTILTSLHPERVNRQFDFAVRSISDRDFIFVDYLGRVGQATRVR